MQEAQSMKGESPCSKSPYTKSVENSFSKEFVNNFNQNEKDAINFVANSMEQNKSLMNEKFIIQARELAIEGRLKAEMRKVNSYFDFLSNKDNNDCLEYPCKDLM